MSLKNTREQFGLLTKLCHWSIFILFCTQFFFVYRREDLLDGDPFKLKYILWHKAVGMILLVIALFMIFWRHQGTRPPLPVNISYFEKISARLVHFGLYFVMLAMPITGYLMSNFSGRPVSIFGLFTVPLLFEPHKPYASLMHTTHGYLSYLIMGLVGIHILATLKHRYIDNNDVLKRMAF